MSMIALLERSVDAAVRALGDLVRDVKVAEQVRTKPMPGQDFQPDYVIHTGKGAWEKVDYHDFPGTQIMVGDRTLLLMQCAHEVSSHEFVYVDGQSFHIYDVKPDMSGPTRVLQKLLCRAEPVRIEWGSDGQTVASS